jgi:hypothetical protein
MVIELADHAFSLYASVRDSLPSPSRTTPKRQTGESS